MTRQERRRQTEERILGAARALFAEVGYERATIRGVAAAAGVDPALVMQYFGAKDELFRRAIHAPGEQPLEIAPERLADLLLEAIRFKLGETDDGSLALFRSMLTHPDAAEHFRTATARQVREFATGIPRPDGELRASLLVAISMGLTIARELLRLEPLQEATPEQIVDLLRPAFQSLSASG
ncbi:MAG: TetR family transcriptional regulator [Micromonosporaceae bacterium]|nr:TetR family transcriptional regulator [Micromonosporaceae bacterium]